MTITLKLLALLRGAKPSNKLLYSGWSFFKMYPMNTVLAGFDFDILPTVQLGAVYFHRLRENISERTLIVAQALIRAFGAMRLVLNNPVSDA